MASCPLLQATCVRARDTWTAVPGEAVPGPVPAGDALRPAAPARPGTAPASPVPNHSISANTASPF